MLFAHSTEPEQENDMTTKYKVARRKLSMLELATELNNISKACRIMGYSRQQFYEIRRNFQTYGAEGHCQTKLVWQSNAVSFHRCEPPFAWLLPSERGS